MPTFIRIFSAFLCLGLCSLSLQAQKDSDVLFTVDDQPVTVGEFRYIYGKTNAEAADYSRQSVEEYLDLYQRFKLKVAQARKMGLDTVRSLQQELAGYRRQLADNYLIDRAVTDPLVETLYERRKKDIEVHHILVAFPGQAGEPDAATISKFQRRAEKIKEGLTTENFAEVAREKSEDKYSKARGGRIGYVTAPFPKGLHQLEAALYDAPLNRIVGPIRTAAGYHLAMKTAERPARGEVEVGHVLARIGEKQNDAAALAKIKKAQAELKAGGDWKTVAAEYSEDGNTKGNGGYLGFFGINRYDPAFEEAAFALKEDGQISDVVKTKAGYHLIRRVSRRDEQTLAEARPLLENKLKQDPRTLDARAELMETLRGRYDFRFNDDVFQSFLDRQVDSSFFDVRWQPNAADPSATLVAFGDDYRLTVGSFAQHLKKNSRQRLQMGRQLGNSGGNAGATAGVPRQGRGARVDVVSKRMYEAWLDQQTKDYAESRLEADFPDFAALMREYREGILLFEATKLEVWDKAGEDTLGLQAFFDAHRDDYQFDEQYVVTEYTVDTRSGTDPATVRAKAGGHDRKTTLADFPKGVKGISREYDAEGLARLNGSLPARAGATSPLVNNLKNGQTTFYKVERVVPPRPKELADARGYVIADYQDHLEKEWVESLRKTFPVKVNKRVLNKLIK